MMQAREERAVRESLLDEGIHLLLERQFDIDAHGAPEAFIDR